jgi:hypothetical protein
VSDDDEAMAIQRIEVVVTHRITFPDGIPPLVIDFLQVPYKPPAVRVVIRTFTDKEVPPMGVATVSVDTTTAKATVQFTDDKGDPVAAPANAAIAFAGDNDAVATVAPDPSDPLSADITPTGIGTVNIFATVTDSTTGGPLQEVDLNGNPVVDANGNPVTFANPAPLAQPVVAGAAAALELGTTA